MSLKCGIIGLPNVGKSTLFNALSESSIAEAANYPFCTIEPNEAKVVIPDTRLDKLALLAASSKVVHNRLEIVDIAGLVKGASKGEGLGNKFLGHIREVDAILHVVRCFEDENIKHVSEIINPISDIELVEMELIISDIQNLEKRIDKIKDKAQKEYINILIKSLEQEIPARSVKGVDEVFLKSLNLITYKPFLYICNVEETSVISGNSFSERVRQQALQKNMQSLVVSAKIEAEISTLSCLEDKQMFMEDLGLKESGLSRVAQESFKLLNLISFFTVGPKEARSWSVLKGSTAPSAAGVIHTDFQKGFIKAEVISYEDYIFYGNELKCREAGKLRIEGKEYIIKDSDVIHFRFNN